MFDRFTDEARKVMALSRKEAQRYNHDFIGTEHILLGLVDASRSVETALRDLGIDEKSLRKEIEKLRKSGNRMSPMGQLPFTTYAKKTLERTMEWAHQLGHDFIDSEHVLLGLMDVAEGVAARALLTLCPDLERLRGNVVANVQRLITGLDPASQHRQAACAWESLRLAEELAENLPAAQRLGTDSLHAEGFVLVDKEGKPRGRFGLSASGEPEFVLLDKEGRERAVVRLREGGAPEVQLMEPDGKAVFRAP